MRQVRRIPDLPPRASDAHKGDFGRVLIVAGSREMLGAAVLCARAAMRAGAGLVRVALPAELLPLLPLAVPEATTCERRAAPLRRALAEADAVVVGPGLSAASTTRAHVQLVLEHAQVPVVLDADALNVLAPLGEPLACEGPVVMTPHPGEAGRLLDTSARAVQRDRLAAVEQLCRRSGALAVLKGEGTLICDGERVFKNRTGNPGMATAGAGDVLSGLLGALLALGLDPFDACCLAVRTHGAAGDRVLRERSVHGLIASDLCDAVAKELP